MNFLTVKNSFEYRNNKSELNTNTGIESFSSFGKVVQVRRIGNIAFYKVRRGMNDIQLVFRKSFTKNIEAQKDIHYGDWINFSGKIGYTSTGEVSVFVDEFEITSKCQNQMPEKHSGISKESRYHNRHLDLMTDTDSVNVFVERARIIGELRGLFGHLLEVETPALQKQASGAAATPFDTKHLNSTDLHLRISPELNLKRLMVGNIHENGVFEIGKSFRNEGLSNRHNPEFTMLEAYEYSNSHDNESSYLEMLNKIEQICNYFYGKDIQIWSFKNWNEEFKNIPQSQENFDNNIEPILLERAKDKILIVKDHFANSSPLAKHIGDYAARCEVYVNGIEVMNAYVEQNDPDEQRKAFEKQGFVDESYIECLKYGLPQTIGIGIGIDRLVMTILNLQTIKDTILFPL